MPARILIAHAGRHGSRAAGLRPAPVSPARRQSTPRAPASPKRYDFPIHGILTKAERRMYPGGRPNRVARGLNRWWAFAHGTGLLPTRFVTLEVPGRRTGKTLSFALVMVHHEGERYLVSMLGENSNWVRNVRAAGGRATLRHGRREPVVLEDFSRIAPQVPVFRVRSDGPPPRHSSA